MGDPRLPDQVKRGGAFNPEDLETMRRLHDALSELPGYKFRYLNNHGTLERDLSELTHRSRLQPVRRGLEQRPLQGAARAGAAGDAGHRLHRRRAVGARRLLRQGPGARRRARARRAGAARDLRAPRRPGRDAAVGVPGAAEAQPRRQQPGHHQGCGGLQREGAARFARPAARRTSPGAACWCRSS